MKKSKFVRLLKTFSITEINRFHEFVATPLFNKNKKCMELMDALLPFAPDFEDERLDDNFMETIYANKNSIKTLLQAIVRLLEEFLAIEELNREQSYKQYLVLKQLQRRKESKHFLMVYKRAVKDFNRQNKKSLLDFYQQFLIATEYFQYQFSTPDSGDPNYEELLDYLDTAYLANRLKYASGMINLQRIKTGAEAIPSEGTMLELADEEHLVNNAVVSFYKSAYLLIKNNQEADFLALTTQLAKNISILPKEEAASLYTAAINFCIQKISSGDLAYYHKLFDIFKICIEEAIFIINGRLGPARLMNTMIVGVKTNNFEWTEAFLDNYNSYLNPDFREIFYYYCKGYLYYNQDELDKASEVLRKANMQGTPKNTSQFSVIKFLKFNIQSLLLKIYYENDELFALESLVKSFSERLRHTKDINPKEIKGYRNFVTMTNMIFRYKTDPNFKKTLPEISARLEKLGVISDKGWLLRKLEELG